MKSPQISSQVLNDFQAKSKAYMPDILQLWLMYKIYTRHWA